MIKVGLTGGIGSGKTTIAHFFEELNVPVYFSDIEAKKIMVEDIELKQNLIELLGSDVYFENGELNKPYISNLIFNNKDLLENLNSIVHPAVKSHFIKFCDKHKKAKYIIKESAILIESGLYKELDKIILVIANKEDRIRRVAFRDNLSFEAINNKISKQMEDKDKIQFSDFVISNDNTQLLIPQLIKIHKSFIK